MADRQFVEVRKVRITCPVCGKKDWCGISTDRVLVICMRTPSDRPTRNGGWLHRLDGTFPHRSESPRPRPRGVPARTDWMRLTRRYTQAADLRILARELGVSVEALRRLQAGFDGRNWAFPMRDADDRIVGIHLRGPNRKFAVRGSRTGIFWPHDVDPYDSGDLYIVEGPTDCAAMLDLGFDCIGRPSCAGAVETVKQWLRHRRRTVIIVADNDPPKLRPDGSTWRPGTEGARRLAEAIAPLVRRAVVIKPPGYKDVRDWKNAGATRQALLALVNRRLP